MLSLRGGEGAKLANKKELNGIRCEYTFLCMPACRARVTIVTIANIDSCCCLKGKKNLTSAIRVTPWRSLPLTKYSMRLNWAKWMWYLKTAVLNLKVRHWFTISAGKLMLERTDNAQNSHRRLCTNRVCSSRCFHFLCRSKSLRHFRSCTDSSVRK